MKSLERTVNFGFALALTLTLSQLVSPQPASAQIFDLLSGAYNLLSGNKDQSTPQPIIQPQSIPQNRNFTLGTSNFNGNTMNLCLSGCVPNASAPVEVPVPNSFPPAPAPVGVPVPNSFPPAPAPVGVPVPSQSSIATSTMQTQIGTLPPGAMIEPGVPIPPQAVAPLPPQPEPQPNRPVLTIPPISLPINF